MSVSIGEATLHLGDCREILKSLPEQSVNTCVTSPPYFGLRDYGMDDQIGLEPTPDEFVAALVEVFREVRRVLRDDGTVWLNLGDSYARQAGNEESKLATLHTMSVGQKKVHEAGGMRKGKNKPPPGLKQKDLIGIPWRVAFALQADGWYLRQDIIWHKPNPMPESVRDRCTKAHEYIFLLSKSPRYYFDAEAIAEASTSSFGKGIINAEQKVVGVDGHETKRAHSGWMGGDGKTRNKRSVWTITPKPFRGAHFATFPPDLVEPCILAGCPEKVCAMCGAPWVRVVEREKKPTGRSDDSVYSGAAFKDAPQSAVWGPKKNLGGNATSKTIGFRATCDCNGDTTSGVVLDPFGGAGTTALVANRHGRKSILCELNPEYLQIAADRLEGDIHQKPLFSGGQNEQA